MDVTPPESLPVPQPLFQRDPTTGLIKGKTYKYTPEGRIDWRAMVDAKFLYVAREHEEKVMKEQGKPLAEVDLLLVRDDWLRIRVGGLNQLAHMRGVRSCRYPHVETREGHATVSCEITFIGNSESGMEPETWSGIASASIRSVDKHFIPYLETFAENRAFSRCVKRALQINILSDIEVGGEGKKAAEGGSSATPTEDAANASDEQGNNTPAFLPYEMLAKKCAALKITFEALKARTVEVNAAAPENEKCLTDPATWNSFADIQPRDVFLLLGKIASNEKAKKSQTGKAAAQ